MWVPYHALGPLKVEGDREAAAASERDRTPRSFLISFFLCSPWTRTIETDIGLEQECRVVLDDPAGRIRTARLCCGASGRLAEVLVAVEGESAHAALAEAWPAVHAACARWSVASGRGLAVIGWKIADTVHRARWAHTPFRPSTVPLPELATLPLRCEHWLLLRAYEEGRRGWSAPLRLLAANRILMAHRNRDEPFTTTDRLARAHGLTRAEPVVGRLDLVLADWRALVDEPLPIPLDRVAERLRPVVQRARELLDDRSPPTDGTSWYDLTAERDLTGAANLADLLAHRILCEELSLLQRMADPAVAAEPREERRDAATG
ncbi:MAG: methylamine utilization protein MauJ [Geminicoccaceae bacterium]|nr:methylamine utilization protein MauJ [Geminicoccaceae bacterium]